MYYFVNKQKKLIWKMFFVCLDVFLFLFFTKNVENQLFIFLRIKWSKPKNKKRGNEYAQLNM